MPRDTLSCDTLPGDNMSVYLKDAQTGVEELCPLSQREGGVVSQDDLHCGGEGADTGQGSLHTPANMGCLDCILLQNVKGREKDSGILDFR